MMGRQPKVQNKLFHTAINLEQRVRQNHILRQIKSQIDFDFIYNEVKDKYGIKGNESVAPPIILKWIPASCRRMPPTIRWSTKNR